jgi:uncharacterized protein (DUF433 family)
MDCESIECTPDICCGAPRFKGTRITVFNLVNTLSRESSLDDYLDAFPNLSKCHVVEAVNYCRLRICEQDKPKHYCDGCTLRTKYDGTTFEEFKKTVTSSSNERSANLDPGNTVFLGSEEELYDEWKGIDGWRWAEDLYIHLCRENVMKKES